MQAKRAFEPAAPLVADERLRLLPRVATMSLSPSARVAVVAAILFVHAALIAVILYRDSSKRFDVQPEQEIPVEVVAEVPQPPAPQPEPKPQEDYDKPAYSAPRAPSAVATDQSGAQDKTEAPQAQSKAQDGAPAPANEADPAPQPVTSALRGTADEKIADNKAEPFEAASPLPDKSPGQAMATAKSQNTAETDVLRQLSAQPAFSNFSFAASTRLAPLTGGTEDNRFMANVFAKILSKKRYPQSAAARRASGTVMVSFIIDGEGRLVYQTISHSSGEPDIDAEAIAAVKAAAPYPPPPPGAPRSLLATLKF
jgi:protein TonB